MLHQSKLFLEVGKLLAMLQVLRYQFRQTGKRNKRSIGKQDIGNLLDIKKGLIHTLGNAC